MYKKDLALHNLQWFICHKIQPNQIIYLKYIYKEDLALEKLQSLICHKTPTKPNLHRMQYFVHMPFHYICLFDNIYTSTLWYVLSQLNHVILLSLKNVFWLRQPSLVTRNFWTYEQNGLAINLGWTHYFGNFMVNHIYQPLRPGRIWHMVNF